MSWKFPERVPVAGEAIDAADLNSALVPYVEEFGSFSEQNLGAATATTLARETQVADDVSLRYQQESIIDDQSNNVITANTATIASTETWEAVDGDKTTATIVTDGNALYVLFSFQFCIQDIGTDDDVYTLFAIRVDGTVLRNSVVGDQDTQQAAPFMEIGVSGYIQGVDVDASFPLAPGTHRIELVAKAISRKDVEGTGSLTTRVHTREMVIVELK